MRVSYLIPLLFFLPLCLWSQSRSDKNYGSPEKQCTIANPKLLKVPESSVEKPVEAVINILRRQDSDCDGISNADDNCLTVPSQNQRDSDGDGRGDPCDNESSDVSIRIQADRRPVRRGQTIDLTLQIRDRGPKFDSGELEITALFPGILHVISMSPHTQECDESEGGLICDANALIPGKSVRIIVKVRAMKAGRGLITAKVENGMGDLHRADNSAAFRFTVIP